MFDPMIIKSSNDKYKTSLSIIYIFAIQKTLLSDCLINNRMTDDWSLGYIFAFSGAIFKQNNFDLIEPVFLKFVFKELLGSDKYFKRFSGYDEFGRLKVIDLDKEKNSILLKGMKAGTIDFCYIDIAIPAVKWGQYVCNEEVDESRRQRHIEFEESQLTFDTIIKRVQVWRENAQSYNESLKETRESQNLFTRWWLDSIITSVYKLRKRLKTDDYYFWQE